MDGAPAGPQGVTVLDCAHPFAAPRPGTLPMPREGGYPPPMNIAMPSSGKGRLLAFVAGCIVLAGCSIQRLAVNKVGDALASGTSTWGEDEDVDLVGDALPFSLKLVESLLAESPGHRGLRLTASRGFVTYSYGWVQPEAERVADHDVERARELRARARKLYLRAFDHGMQALEMDVPGLRDDLVRDPRAAAARVVPGNGTGKNKTGRSQASQVVPELYWSAAALGLAISVSRNDAAMLARLPEVDALIARAIELDEGWDSGALHGFQVVLAGARPGQPDEQAIVRHFDRALSLSGGHDAGLFVARAEALAVPRQDRAAFDDLLRRALAVDVDALPEKRMVNLIAQRRARWLAGRADELFLADDGLEGGEKETGGTP